MIWAAAIAIVCWFGNSAAGQSIPGTEPNEHVQWHEGFAGRFKAGDTNVPMLAMSWYAGGTEFCTVERSGKVVTLFLGFSAAGSPGHLLDTTNRLLLTETINTLPSQPNVSVPPGSQILVSGIRSNQWFRFAYDRSDVPKEVRKLYEITGARLDEAQKPQGKSVAPIK